MWGPGGVLGCLVPVRGIRCCTAVPSGRSFWGWSLTIPACCRAVAIAVYQYWLGSVMLLEKFSFSQNVVTKEIKKVASHYFLWVDV